MSNSVSSLKTPNASKPATTASQEQPVDHAERARLRRKEFRRMLVNKDGTITFI